MFWFRKPPQTPSFSPSLVIFGIVMSCITIVFLWINTLLGFWKASIDKKASIAEKLTWWVDSDVSKLVAKSSFLYQTILSGWSLLDYQSDLQEVIRIIKTNTTIKTYLPKKFLPQYDLAQRRLKYSDDLIDLMWPDRIRTYFVALMNTSEIRPNGGFFWSYAIVQLYKGKLVHYKVYDTYYAYYQNTGTKVSLTKEYQTLLGQQTINIVSPNLYGQTNIDAGNIKILYEQLFPSQPLDGVILVDTDLLTSLLPSLKPKLVEWQFINAAIDLIRWWVSGGKKQQYLAEIGLFIETHKDELIDQIISNSSTLLSSHHMQLYLPKSSKAFQVFLEKEWAVNTLHNDDLTIHHINKSFNKVDTFVSKKYTLQDQQGKLIFEWSQPEIAMSEIEDMLKRWDIYDLYLFYTLSVPQRYLDQIFSLTKQYEIELTPREQHILGLSYNRHNQLIVHLPSNLLFESIDGSVFCKNQNTLSWALSSSPVKTTPSSCFTLINSKYNQILSFDMVGFGNNVLKVVRVRLRYTGK